MMQSTNKSGVIILKQYTNLLNVMDELSSYRSCVEQKKLIENLVDQGFISPNAAQGMIQRLFKRHYDWVKEINDAEV